MFCFNQLKVTLTKHHKIFFPNASQISDILNLTGSPDSFSADAWIESYIFTYVAETEFKTFKVTAMLHSSCFMSIINETVIQYFVINKNNEQENKDRMTDG